MNNLPIGYTLCEYIESDGTNYIDTGVSPDGNTRITADIQLLNLTNADFGTSPTLFGAYSSPSARYALYWSHTGRRFGTYYAGESHDFNDTTDGYARISVDYNGNIHTLNGESYTYEPSTAECVDTIYLFGNNTTGSAWFLTLMRLYSCQIYDNGILVRDYIPCMNANNVYGLYDKVNGVFYTSATDSGFTGKWAEHKVLNVSLAEYRHRMLNLIQKRGLPDYSDYRGVYIEDVDGYLYTEAEWDGSKTPNGVAVLTDNCRFVMALQDAYTGRCPWSSWGKLVYGITTVINKSEAKADYDGKAQTTTILSELGDSSSTAPAAHYCRAFTFPNGKKGYMGAAGEWQAALDNKEAIVSALRKCGVSAMSYYYWTSTQYTYEISWVMDWRNGTLSFVTKAADDFVRAFTTLKSDDQHS